MLSLPWLSSWRYACSCWQTPSPLCCLLLSFTSTRWPQSRYRSTWAAARNHPERALPVTLKGRFWAAVAAVCSPSFHLSISFSAPVLSSGQSRPEVKIQWLIYSRQQAANPQQCLCNIELLQLLFHSFPQKAIRFLLLFSQTLVESVYAHLCLFSAAILPTFGDTVTNGSGEMQ